MRHREFDARRRPRNSSRVVGYLSCVTVVLLAVAPVVWVFKMSVISRAELFASPPTLLPETFTFDHYRTVFSSSDMSRGLLNSVIIASSTTLLCLLLAVPAGYALARLHFSLRQTLLTGILTLAFFPAVAVIAPLFLQFRTFGLLNTFASVILTDTVFTLPLAIWLLAAFFRQLPSDLEDAAKIDGAGILRTVISVILPLAAPGIATAGIITFIVAWNEFLFANTFLYDADTWPATVVIPSFATQHSVDYGAQAAASIVVTVPLVILTFLFQRRIVQGLSAGAVKG